MRLFTSNFLLKEMEPNFHRNFAEYSNRNVKSKKMEFKEVGRTSSVPNVQLLPSYQQALSSRHRHRSLSLTRDEGTEMVFEHRPIQINMVGTTFGKSIDMYKKSIQVCRSVLFSLRCDLYKLLSASPKCPRTHDVDGSGRGINTEQLQRRSGQIPRQWNPRQHQGSGQHQACIGQKLRHFIRRPQSRHSGPS